MMAYLFFGPYDWLMIPGLLLGMYAQFRLMATYGRYSREGVATGISGAEAAREILDRAGLHHMPVLEVAGHLTDHYDPVKKQLCLSSENYHGRSLAAVGVAAHEAGHALQHQAAYAPLKMRMALVPVTGFASSACWFILFGGFLLSMLQIISAPVYGKFLGVAVGLFSVVTFFQLITLPVEYDASRRARERLLALGLIHPAEAP
ncbi:MAG TPA: zinc metallopeptidase, partial [Methylomirabilota bacterium]|nr:zinc metallopeptidase [Methylomirabilota bacterium]